MSAVKHTPMIVAAARTMCKLESEACGVDNEDLWKIYGHEFLNDAEEVVRATSAPELLEALRTLLEVWPNTDKQQGWTARWIAAQDKARAALSKATGEQS